MGHFVSGMACHGAFCKEKQLLCSVPTGDTWFLVGTPYVSHCFTNEVNDWRAWFRDFGDMIRGHSRECDGVTSRDLPDSQSCGEDGVVVGLHCYGEHCDRIQLICMTIDAEVDPVDGQVSSAETEKVQLISEKLLVDPRSWQQDFPVVENGGPVKTLLWDGKRTVPTSNDDDLPLLSYTCRLHGWYSVLSLISLVAAAIQI